MNLSQVSFLDESEIKSALNRYSVYPSKKKGQSFLKSEKIAQAIVDAAEISPTESILEVGGGLGILTKLLVETGAKVTVVELDSGLVKALKDRFVEQDNIHIVQGDALSVQLPDVDKIVSNLPYSISSEITFRFLRDVNFKLAILMYQKEFAQRLLATATSPIYSRLSIDFQYLGEASIVRDVKAGNFYPIPAVDSTVLKITKKTSGPVAKDDGVFFWMINGLYSYPNKQLKKALKIWMKTLGRSESADNFLSKLGDIDPTTRLRSLSLDTLVTLADITLEMIQQGELPAQSGD